MNIHASTTIKLRHNGQRWMLTMMLGLEPLYSIPADAAHALGITLDTKDLDQTLEYGVTPLDRKRPTQ